jgi:predicted phage terminase large subunit-like protein
MDEGVKREYIGTFYAYGDTYHAMIEAGIRLRLHPCYELTDLELDPSTGIPVEIKVDRDKPVFRTKEFLEKEERRMGPKEFGTQLLCNPSAGQVQAFDRAWLRYYDGAPAEERRNKTVYMLVDPANEKKKDSDYTSIWIIGLGPDGNYYILDGVRDRMDLRTRIDVVMALHKMWSPIDQVRYEKYGLFIDTSYLRIVQENTKYRFPIVEVGSKVRKDDRIARLVPLFHSGRIYLPKKLLYYSQDRGEIIDLVQTFINEEYTKWPNSTYKDMLDSLARIAEPDIPLNFPQATDYWDNTIGGDRWKRAIKKVIRESRDTKGSWMAA